MKPKKVSKDNRTIVLFPKGETQVADFLSIDFGEVNLGKKVAIGRYPLSATDQLRFKDLESQIKPFLQKNLVLIPGIKTAFVHPKSSNKLEFAIAIDYEKSKSFFTSAKELHLRSESVLSMDIVKMLLKTHLLRGGIVL
jgi:hypothetical protein